MANRHYHHTLRAPSLPDIHLPTGHWDLDDVEAQIDELECISRDLVKFFDALGKDLCIYLGASADPARMIAVLKEEIRDNYIHPLEQVRDTIEDENDGGRRFYSEHSTLNHAQQGTGS